MVSPPFNQLTPLEGPFTLNSGSMYHFVSSEGGEILVSRETQPYPIDPPPILGEILLDSCESELLENNDFTVCYRLPTDYSPLGAVINEALSNGNPRGETTLEVIFTGMGRVIHSLREASEVLEPFSYTQVLVSKRKDQLFSLIPPIKVAEGNQDEALEKLTSSLRAELSEKAVTEQRRDRILHVFRSFEAAAFDGVI